MDYSFEQKWIAAVRKKMEAEEALKPEIDEAKIAGETADRKIYRGLNLRRWKRESEARRADKKAYRNKIDELFGRQSKITREFDAAAVEAVAAVITQIPEITALVEGAHTAGPQRDALKNVISILGSIDSNCGEALRQIMSYEPSNWNSETVRSDVSTKMLYVTQYFASLKGQIEAFESEFSGPAGANVFPLGATFEQSETLTETQFNAADFTIHRDMTDQLPQFQKLGEMKNRVKYLLARLNNERVRLSKCADDITERKRKLILDTLGEDKETRPDCREISDYVRKMPVEKLGLI